MVFEDDVVRFVKRYLEPRGLPIEIFEFDSCGWCDMLDIIITPIGVSVTHDGDSWVYDVWMPCKVGFGRGWYCDVDELMDEVARWYGEQQKAKETKRKAKERRKKIAALEKENAKLRRKIEKLQLQPGGKEYETAKKHFDGLAKK